MIRSGGMQSLPLAVEWSVSDSQEYLLAGCHDGTVALWKFSVSDQLKDTKPLLCFTADKFPIRSVAWAPHESDPEAANVIVTAGHGGIKFWDIRDPFQPLWDLHSFPHHILGLDWVPDPRCITFAFDDGTLKFISLSKAANDTPVTGKPFGVTKGFLHSYPCSSFAMWSLHVSRHTGIVAYCTADGNVLCFQLTTKAVEKESLRYRTPHFMCVSVTEEKPAIVLNMSASEVPITRKKSIHSEDTAIGIYDDQREKKRWTPESEDRPLALCYGNDPSRDSELEENLPSSKKKKSLAKSKAPDKRTWEADLALVCSDKEPENKAPEEENKGDPGLPFETLPPKIVAMHRVRWNSNKDGAKWLCSGGAAGIVRCQEINIPIVRNK
ncbi:hypothetical protein MLD38_002978 [Melastoma candidum]|nr:hypothetical protein MLD38_002978 [Melastoma candidum]